MLLQHHESGYNWRKCWELYLFYNPIVMSLIQNSRSVEWILVQFPHQRKMNDVVNCLNVKNQYMCTFVNYIRLQNITHFKLEPSHTNNLPTNHLQNTHFIIEDPSKVRDTFWTNPPTHFWPTFMQYHSIMRTCICKLLDWWVSEPWLLHCGPTLQGCIVFVYVNHSTL